MVYAEPEVRRLMRLDAFQECLTTKDLGRSMIQIPPARSSEDMAEIVADSCTGSNIVVVAAPSRKPMFTNHLNANLVFTMLLMLSHNATLFVPMLSAMAVTSACRQQGVNAWIHWPNQIYVGDRSVAEISVRTHVPPEDPPCDRLPPDTVPNLVTVDIRVDAVSWRPEDLNPPRADDSIRNVHDTTSLEDVLGRRVSHEQVFASVLNALEPLLSRDMREGEVVAEYLKYDGLLGRRVSVNHKLVVGGPRPAGFSGVVTGYTGSAAIVERKGDGDDAPPTPTPVYPVRSFLRVETDDRRQLPTLLSDRTPAMINGTWKNQLGSTMDIDAMGSDDGLKGIYRTAVGNAEYGNMTGWFSSTLEGGALMGWTVSWSHPINGPLKSMASWAGRVRVMPDGSLRLETAWVLVSEERDPSDDWRMINVNKDIFFKH